MGKKLSIGDRLWRAGRNYILTGFSRKGKIGWVLQDDSGRLRFVPHKQFVAEFKNGSVRAV